MFLLNDSNGKADTNEKYEILAVTFLSDDFKKLPVLLGLRTENWEVSVTVPYSIHCYMKMIVK